MTYEQLSIAINTIKNATKHPFSATFLRSKFKELGIPRYNEFVTVFISQGIIKRDNNSYIWADNNPIHINRIKELRKKVTAKVQEYNSNKNNKHQFESVIEEGRKELCTLDNAILKAIELLLKNGYRVSKPIIIYKEITNESIHSDY